MTERSPLDALAAEMGAAVGEVEARVAELDRRLTASESATVDLILQQEREIAELRRRLEQMEARAVTPAPGPRLIHDADAA